MKKRVYFVLEGDGYGPPMMFDSKDQAAAFCHANDILSFYEVDPKKPMTPVNLWELVPSGDTYKLTSKDWKQVEKDHADRHGF